MQSDAGNSLATADLAVHELYNAAGIHPDSGSGALSLARALFGADSVRFVPRDWIPGKSLLLRDGERPVIWIREGLPDRFINHCTAHELGEWHLFGKGYVAPDIEDAARSIAAAICVPRSAFHTAVGYLSLKIPRFGGQADYATC